MAALPSRQSLALESITTWHPELRHVLDAFEILKQVLNFAVQPRCSSWKAFDAAIFVHGLQQLQRLMDSAASPSSSACASHGGSRKSTEAFGLFGDLPAPGFGAHEQNGPACPASFAHEAARFGNILGFSEDRNVDAVRSPKMYSFISGSIAASGDEGLRPPELFM